MGLLLPSQVGFLQRNLMAELAPDFDRETCKPRVLNIELQHVEVVSDSVLSCALILVGVSCVAALFLAVPEEPASAEAGERGHEGAPASLLHGSGHGQAAGKGTSW